MRTTPAISPSTLSAPVSVRRAVWLSFVKAAKRALLAYEIHRERRALMILSDHQLKDIGLSRAEAYRESCRGVFDLPHRPEPRDRWLHW